ncbi:MAG: M3 family oligoendopeptidase [Anaerolineae bacterium]
MFEKLPDLQTFMTWSWAEIEPFFKDLQARELNDSTAVAWLTDAAHLNQRISETFTRLNVATTVNTADEAATERFLKYNEEVIVPVRTATNELQKKILASGINPPGYGIELRNIRVQSELFREDNLPLQVEEDRLRTEYDKVIGAQTVNWDGQEKTLASLKPFYFNPDRSVRERAWRAASDRQLADKQALNDLWVQFLKLRQQIALNADLPDYRAYMWRSMLRFDYTPQDCETFHAAIEKVVVPAATRIYEKRRQRLGISSVRPWDTFVDPLNREALQPFPAQDIGRLNNTSSTIFHKVDPVLGGYFDTMMNEGLLDLDNRKGKAPGGYCTGYDYSKRPFIFMNAVGIHDDVQTLLHEGGHAFHAFETYRQLPDYLQGQAPMEFCEVASMSMELIAAPYLAQSQGGFYSAEDAARARVEHLEQLITFWPYMAIVDAFQHWVYTHVDDAIDPAKCDAKWAELNDRFMPGIDYSGLEDAKADGWHRKLHIFQVPFYYVEYGLAQLGAVQVWGNSLKDQAGAVSAYRRALALGGTATLPQLFQTAGAQFGWDTSILHKAVDLVENVVNQLDPA